MRSHRLAYALAAALSLSAVAAGPAGADDSKAARAAYIEGTRLYDLGEYQSALDAFKRAYVAYESPAFLYNIAQCHRYLGHRDEALRFYRLYLERAPDASDRAQIEQYIKQLEVGAAPAATAPAPAPPPPAPAAMTPPAPAAVTTAPSSPARTVEPAPAATPPVRTPPPSPTPTEATPAPTTPAPAPTAAATLAAVVPVTASPPPVEPTPLYKKWWLWTGVAAVVVAGAAIGVGVAVAESGSAPPFQTTLMPPTTIGVLVGR